MSSGEHATTLRSVIGDENIHDIIDHRLVATDYPGSNTEKYFVDGLPQVVIRHTAGEPQPDQIEKVANAYNKLPAHGIQALPYISVPHRGGIYVVTRKLHGVNLQDMLQPNASTAVHVMVDERWARIVEYISSGRVEGRDCATDINHFGSYMFGRTAVVKEDALTLVDLGEATFNYAEAPFRSAYDRVVLSTAGTVVEMEGAFNRELPAARLALNKAIDIAVMFGDPKGDYRQAIIDTAKRVLRDSVVIDYDDEADSL